MNKNVTMGLMATLLSLNFCATAQEPTPISPIYGTPDKFQRYFVLDPLSYPEATQWRLSISHDYLSPEDSSIVRQRVESVTIEDKSFFKLEDYHYGDDFGTHVSVQGLDGAGNVIIEDDWIRPVPTNHKTWLEHCKGICNSTTYAYSVKILEEFERQDNPSLPDYGEYLPTGIGAHRVSFDDPHHMYDPDEGLYIPLYRYMVLNEWLSLQGNSNITDDGMDWNTFAHYDLPHNTEVNNSDGLKVVYYPNAATGQFKNMQNVNISDGEVWGVQKFFGIYRNDRPNVSNNLINDPGGICGTLLSGSGTTAQNQVNDAVSFTNYANNHLIFTDELVCSIPRPLPGTPNPGSPRPLPNVSEYVFIHDAWVNWINDNPQPGVGGGLFGLMETAFEGSRSQELFTNTTGVPWWPGDEFDYIQLYRVDRTTSEEFAIPYTIYRDSLFNENGSLKSFEINTPAGLYNLSLTISETAFHMPLLVDFPTALVHQSTQSICDRLDISIYAVPIVDKKFTTQVSSDENVKFNYTVSDDLGGVHFQRMVNVRANQTHKIPVTTPHLPNGLIFHTFEVEGECVRTITTIKNE